MRSGRCSRRNARTRVQWLALIGVAVTVGFVLLRATNLYGDPQPWVAHESALATLLSFINTEKYPPSLLYLMMTLGPGLLLLAAVRDRARTGRRHRRHLRPRAVRLLHRRTST